jgi:nitroimidazol reductase NimA-like FMN-containing flavoprotein (pyridoxamine 5'-phosphate oxidase superfamily)
MTERTRIRRLPDKARTERADLDAILDAAVIAHVGIMDQGQPYVLPMGFARDGDRLLLHGSTGSRLMRLLADGVPVCVTVTHLDGLVLARSAFNSSMNYRSAMILGTAVPVTDELEALRLLTEHLLPGRWEHLRAPLRKELAATMVLELLLDEWSVKVSEGMPDDPPEDLAETIWAGVIPLTMQRGEPVQDVR